MKRKKRPARALRVVAGGAAPAAAASAPTSANLQAAADHGAQPVANPIGPGPGLEEFEAAAAAHARLVERQKLVDQHRGQRSELVARQARETAELIARHVDEEKAQERAQVADFARLRLSQGGELVGWQVRALGSES